MHPLIFATGNADKFNTALGVCTSYGIALRQQNTQLDEIQSEDPLHILNDKIEKAFAALNEPVVVSDDSWNIVGLHGFPGPYMKSINHWLSADDLLRLTQPLQDRRVILTQRIAYKDAQRTKTFQVSVAGTIVAQARGQAGNAACAQIFALHGDGGLTIAELRDSGINSPQRDAAKIWHEFAAWYRQKPEP